MVNMPEMHSFFGFPLGFGCLIISAIGLGIGGSGIAGLVLFGLVEETIEAHMGIIFEEDMKKAVLMTTGLTSIFLIVANGSLLLGVLTSSGAKVAIAKWVALIFITLLLCGIMYAPITCFYDSSQCQIVKSCTIPGLFVMYSMMGVFAMVWLYFTVTMHNYQEQLL